MSAVDGNKKELNDLAASYERQLSVPETLVFVKRAIELVKRFEIDTYEHRSDEDVRHELVPTMRKLTTSAVKLIDKLSEYYGAVVAEDDEFEFAIDQDQVMESTGQGSERDEQIASLCFVGRLEIVQNLQQLRDPLDDVDKWTLISRCIACRGTLFKVAAAIDSAICEREGWSRTLSSDPDLGESLVVRRLYAWLSRRLAEIEPPTAKNVRTTMLEAEAALTEILSSEVERHLRMSDRFQLLQLRNRVVEWLTRPGGDDLDAGVKIWQDLTIAAELLLQINNRAELVTHDRDAASRLAKKLSEPPRAGTAFGAEILETLADLAGRDAELDRWMGRLEQELRSELVRHLERVAARLSPSEAEVLAGGVDLG